MSSSAGAEGQQSQHQQPQQQQQQQQWAPPATTARTTAGSAALSAGTSAGVLVTPTTAAAAPVAAAAATGGLSGTGSDPSTSAKAKTKRVLACVVCQHRKVKCDRRFPCANCVRAGVQCVPAAQAPRQRRRRFPERELLDRLRRYEALLRQHNIDFEPLHPSTADTSSSSTTAATATTTTAAAAAISNGNTTSDGLDQASPASYEPDGSPGDTITSQQKPSSRDPSDGVEQGKARSESVFKPKNFWHAMNHRSHNIDGEDDDSSCEDQDFGDDDDDFVQINGAQSEIRRGPVKRALYSLYNSNDHLLFGSRMIDIDLSTLQPDQVHIFRLWQIYLDNVNPLLKVTHTPTLQPRFIDAAGSVASIEPSLEALMFSVYCMALQSIDDDECRSLFASSKIDLLTSYRFACQQALLKCGVLRTTDRECVTALYLYLVSMRPDTDPRSLSSMFGLAVRIAQRMGIHHESALAKYSPFEAEMRRRLWWSLVVFDGRLSEMSDHKDSILSPNWNCRLPLNVSDFELRPEMKAPPVAHEGPSEALFVIVRSELFNLIRRSASHLDFTNPILKAVAQDVHPGSVAVGADLLALSESVEEKYLRHCDLENPVHCMTVWTSRGHVAKYLLLDHFSNHSSSYEQQTEKQCDDALTYAMRMLECDMKIVANPLTKRYFWLSQFTFPFPAYVHILQDLRKRPLSSLAERAWQLMNDSYEIRCSEFLHGENPFFPIFSRLVLHSWAAREAALRERSIDPVPPMIVLDTKMKRAQMSSSAQSSSGEQQVDLSPPSGSDGLDFIMPTSTDFGMERLPFSPLAGQPLAHLPHPPIGLGPGGFPPMPGPNAMDMDNAHMDWGSVFWNKMYRPGW